MKNKILILIFMFLALFIWSCQEEPPLGPESQDIELNKKVPVGTVTPLLTLETYTSPEGIAIDKSGNMYISRTKLDGTNEIILVTPDGNKELYASLPWTGQLRGLVTDTRGNVYAALADNPNMKGVYRISRNRVPVRLQGSENIGSPNALTFDAKGNLYVSSSYNENGINYDGAIWRCTKSKVFETWLMDDLLDGGLLTNINFKSPGVNGIVFYPPNKIYVANTFQNSICRITIGQIPTIEMIKQDEFLLAAIDGIAVDVHENLYGVLPPSSLEEFPPFYEYPPLVQYNTKNNVLRPIVPETDDDYFDVPTSLAFGTGGSWNRKSVFIVNAALFGPGLGAGPSVVEVFVGTPGKPNK